MFVAQELVIIRAVEPRRRVDARTHALQHVEHRGAVLRIEPRCPLEHEVFEEVRGAGQAAYLIAAAHVVCHHESGDRRPRQRHYEHAQAVRVEPILGDPAGLTDGRELIQYGRCDLQSGYMYRSNSVCRAYLPCQWASSQLSPTLMSTSIGTVSGNALTISSSTIARSWSSSCSGASKTSSSWTCSSIFDSKLSSTRRRWMRIIAILIMSAWEPWIGMFTATRSANDLTVRLRERISGT